MWTRVGCPCPPVRNAIVTLRHLFFLHLAFSFFISPFLSSSGAHSCSRLFVCFISCLLSKFSQIFFFVLPEHDSNPTHFLIHFLQVAAEERARAAADMQMHAEQLAAELEQARHRIEAEKQNATTLVMKAESEKAAEVEEIRRKAEAAQLAMAEAEDKAREADRLAEEAKRVEEEKMELMKKAEEAELSQRRAEEQARLAEEKSLEVAKLNQVSLISPSCSPTCCPKTKRLFSELDETKRRVLKTVLGTF